MQQAQLGRTTHPLSGAGSPPTSSASSPAPARAATDLVANFAPAHGVLDLAPDDDTRTVVALITAGAGPVVLSSEQKAAYALAIFHLNGPSPVPLRGVDR